MPRKPTLTCNRCTKPMWVGRGARREPGSARCMECRRAAPQPYGKRVLPELVPFECVECGETVMLHRPRPDRKFCGRTCANRAKNRASGIARMIRHPEDQRVRRGQRETTAPGLTYTQRKALLTKWKRQRRACAYCPAPATTIDHVLPLVRGGTNYEGNLAPACKTCNSSKSGWTVIEWRTGRRLPPVARAPIYTTPKRACEGCGNEFQPKSGTHRYCTKICRPKPVKHAAVVSCRECGAPTTRPTYCSRACGDRYTARTAYRRRKGIPIGAPLAGNGRPRKTLPPIL